MPLRMGCGKKCPEETIMKCKIRRCMLQKVEEGVFPLFSRAMSPMTDRRGCKGRWVGFVARLFLSGGRMMSPPYHFQMALSDRLRVLSPVLWASCTRFNVEDLLVT